MTETLDDTYGSTRQNQNFKELYEYMKAGSKTEVKPGGEPIPFKETPSPIEEPGIKSVDFDITNPKIEDILGVLLNPGEWPGLVGGGFAQSGIKGAIDWALLGMPSLAKGVVGFGKGIIKGLGAKATEATKPILEGIAGATPEFKVAAEKIPEALQPSIAKFGENVTTQAENVGTILNQKIEETSTKLKDLAGKWDSIKETATRGHISREESRAKGKELGIQIEEIKNLFPGTAMNAEQASALIDTIKPIADDSVQAAQKYLKTKKPEDLHEALYKFYSLMEVDPKRFGVVAEAGRTLSQMNEPISGVNQYLNQFSKTFSELVPEGLTPEYLVHLIGHFETPEQLAVMARHLAKPGSFKSYSNALIEAWTMGLLTGPRTHLVNFTSNLVNMIEGPVERAFAARLGFGGGEHVVKGEATEMMFQGIKGFSDALTLAGKAFKSGISQLGGEKAEFIRSKAISAEALDISGTMGRAVDFLGEVVRIPGRLLVAGDDFFKSLNYRMNIGALGRREGIGKGLEGKDLSEFIESFMRAPSKKADLISSEYANYMTFNKELDGIALSAQKVLQNHPILRVVVPFWRTPVNIMKFSLERTPLLNALSGQLRGDIVAGGVRRDMALGKIAFGASVSAVVYGMARAGYITGSGPSDKNTLHTMEQAGWQKDSIYPHGTGKGAGYSFGRVDPLSQYIGSIADLAAVSDQLDQPRIDQYAMALTLGYMNHMTTKSYLTGLTNVLEAIKQPDQKGVDYIKKWSSSLVPTLVRNVAKEIDPVRRETHGILDQLISNTPYASKTLLPSRDLRGDPIISEGAVGPDLFSFIWQKKFKEDPVWKELYDNKIAISPVSKFMGGIRPPRGSMTQETVTHGVELTPKEYDWVSRMAGNELKVNGKGMWDTLTDLVKTPDYKNATEGPDGMKANLIHNVVNSYRELTFAKLREQDPEKLGKLLTEKEVGRAKRLIGK